MDLIIAACGLDCGACPAYVATMSNDAEALARLAEVWGKQFGFPPDAAKVRCHGCVATDGIQIGHCAECEMRLCAIAKGHGTCAECAGFPCDKLSGFLKEVPEAKARLESLVPRR